jgi:hypothetical protein
MFDVRNHSGLLQKVTFFVAYSECSSASDTGSYKGKGKCKFVAVL